jgi:EmrB/QacA subfamily drug resistance transporter
LVIAATFLDVIDFSIVQVAIPTIEREFLAPLAGIQWIIGAYGLTMAGFLMVSGRAGDIYGQKRVFVVGIVLFTIASLTAGLAPSLLALIASRAIQGVGAAITTATALAILAATFPEGRERNRAFGILVAVLSAGFAAGSIAGGVLTAGFGWRSVLFVNVPIGTAAAILTQRFIPANGGRARDMSLDVPGAVTVTIGLILLVYAFTNAANDGLLTLQTAVPLALSALVLSGFLVIEHRAKAPLMPLSFLRRGSILTANVLGLILAASAGGVSFILTIYLQQVLGYSALSAGLGFLPAALMFFFVGGWGSSWLVNRIGLKPVLLISTTCAALGSALLAPISIGTGYLGILPGFLLWSFGASIGFPALAIAGLAGTQHGEEGLASGLIQTSQRLGFPLGLAVLLTVVSATDAQVGVVGFRYAFLASALLGALGLGIALRIGGERTPRLEVDVVATVAQVQSGQIEK